MHLVSLLELLFDSLQCGQIIASKCQVILISGYYDLDAILGPSPDTMVRGTAREAKIRKGSVQLLVPLPRTLLQAIKRLLETTHKVFLTWAAKPSG